MTFYKPELTEKECDALALALDFLLSNYDDMTADQKNLLENLLFEFDFESDNVDEQPKQNTELVRKTNQVRQGNLIRVDFRPKNN